MTTTSVRSMPMDSYFKGTVLKKTLTIGRRCAVLSCDNINCNGNSVYIFLFLELRGLSPNFHIHVSVSDLYIPRIGPNFSSSRKGRPIAGIYNSLTDTWMWKLGLRPDIPFLGIFVLNFRHFVFAVYADCFMHYLLFLHKVHWKMLCILDGKWEGIMLKRRKDKAPNVKHIWNSLLRSNLCNVAHIFKGTQAWNFFCRNPRACNTRFLKIIFDSAEIFDF